MSVSETRKPELKTNGELNPVALQLVAMRRREVIAKAAKEAKILENYIEIIKAIGIYEKKLQMEEWMLKKASVAVSACEQTPARAHVPCLQKLYEQTLLIKQAWVKQVAQTKASILQMKEKIAGMGGDWDEDEE
jgi:hypothetical protein